MTNDSFSMINVLLPCWSLKIIGWSFRAGVAGKVLLQYAQQNYRDRLNANNKKTIKNLWQWCAST